jgi:hypothetical protein
VIEHADLATTGHWRLCLTHPTSPP